VLRIEEGEEFACPAGDPNCREQLLEVPQGAEIPRWVLGVGAGAIVLLLAWCGTRGRKPSAEEPEPPPIVMATAAPTPLPATPAPQPPPSVEAARVVLRIQASEPIADDLIAPLARGFLEKEGWQSVRRSPAQDASRFLITGQPEGREERSAIEILRASPDVDLTALGSGSADVVVAVRRPRARERDALLTVGDFGSETSDASQKLLARDGIAVLVHKGNSVSGLTTAQVSGILSGEITDWSQVSSQAGPIRLHLPKEGSALLTEVRGAVARAFPKLAMSKATGETRHGAGRELGLRVAADPAGLGVAPMRHAGLARAVPVADEGAAGQLVPTAFTVGMEDYAFYQRVVLYHAAAPKNSETLRFIEYALSSDGQRLVGSAGFVDLDLRPEVRELPAAYRALVPPELRDRLRQTEQLPVNFRFATNSSELDFTARDALARAVRLLGNPEMRARTVLLFGFTDGAGTDEYNFKLSIQRAQAIGALFGERGVKAVHPVGLGKQLPVASNDTPTGMAQNRRVEIWVAELK
jgi:phosphate transport system substrate-binding protein